jgi:hypothetical protein
LDAGGDPNARDSHGATPLHYAASGNRLDPVVFLLDQLPGAGADPNICNHGGISALMRLWQTATGRSQMPSARAAELTPAGVNAAKPPDTHFAA